MQIKWIGIDPGNTTFHLVALGTRCQVVVRKKFSSQQRLLYTANLPSSLLGMEACVGSHFLGRAEQDGRKHSQMACPRTCVEIRLFHDRRDNQAGHARIIMMRPETILHEKPDTFSQTASRPTQFFLHSGGGPYICNNYAPCIASRRSTAALA
jgi:hypothetical protein